DVVSRPECLYARDRLVDERARTGTVGADEQQTFARDEIDQPAERERDRIEVGVDVRVIELDVVDDGNVGQVLEELRRLVEEGAVVLVALDHEIAAMAHAIAGSALAQVAGDAADEHARVEPAVRQQPAGERRGRRLAMSAGDDNRSGAPQEMFPDCFGQRAVADLAIGDLLQIRGAGRDRVASADEIGCPDAKPIRTGPGKPAKRPAITARAVGSPDGSSQRGNSPITPADARVRRPACFNCVTIRSSRYGRSPTSSRKRTYPGGG